MVVFRQAEAGSESTIDWDENIHIMLTNCSIIPTTSRIEPVQLTYFTSGTAAAGRAEASEAADAVLAGGTA